MIYSVHIYKSEAIGIPNLVVVKDIYVEVVKRWLQLLLDSRKRSIVKCLHFIHLVHLVLGI